MVQRKTWIVIVIVVILALLLVKCWGGKAQTEKAISVAVTKAVTGTITPSIEAVGSVEAENTVSVKPQISGQVSQILVNQGQEVTQNQLLFVIDSRPYQAALDQAQALLLKDQAAAKLKNHEFTRSQTLYKQGYISKDAFEQSQSNRDMANATVENDKAAVETAKLNLAYTQIHAPIYGRLGDIEPNVGDIVAPSDATALTTINQFKPIDVTFSVPSTALSTILTAYKKSGISVIATPDANKMLHVKGNLFFIDNQVNKTTGTVLMEARFANEDEGLWPGEFVKVHLDLPNIPNVILLPTIALQQDQNQQYYVYQVDKTKHVHLRHVVPGATQGDQTQIVSGITVGEEVIIRGQFEVTEGSLVSFK